MPVLLDNGCGGRHYSEADPRSDSLYADYARVQGYVRWKLGVRHITWYSGEEPCFFLSVHANTGGGSSTNP